MPARRCRDRARLDRAVAPVNRRRVRVRRAGVGEGRRRQAYRDIFITHLVRPGIHDRRHVSDVDGSRVRAAQPILVGDAQADRERPARPDPPR